MSHDVDPLQRAYDQVPYPSFAFPFTHPARLAAIARLAGLNAPDVSTSRVLELGCASGGNIIPMAQQFPAARFLGIDFSTVEVQQGQRTADALGLRNVELRPMSILDVTRDALGEFDYILAHGVYSWVPLEVREKTLAIFREQLAPSGVAFISFNIDPGRQPQMVLRQLMLLHAGRQGEGAKDEAARLAAGREMLALLGQCFASQQTPFAALLRSEIEVLSKQDDALLLHDSLSEINHPV